jgi:ABC-type uncharacterized transport system involved in gliding motility auxiliary subunit
MAKRILGILSYVGMALVLGALAVRLLKPEWDRYAAYAAWAGLALVVVYTLGQWREIAAYFRHRNARYGAMAGLGVVVVLGILVAVNYLSNRRNTRWDLTANKQYSLSEQTVKLLRGLDAPVKFLVFDKETEFDRFRPRLTSYAYESNNVAVEYIDADKRPVQARQYNVETYGTVVIEYKGRTERVTSDTEQDLTNGLIKVVTGEQKKVYFTQGHGEKNTDSSERNGYNTISGVLGRDNYAVAKVVLAQSQDVPADASVLIVAGPTADLLPPEGDMLKRYLARGGHLLVLLDPPEDKSGPMPVLEGLLKEWAIEAGNDVVVDVSGLGQLLGTDASVPVAAKYSQHPITNGFGVLTAYPLARSITARTEGANGRFPQTIVETSERSWAETNVAELRASGKVEMNPGDKAGPISIAAAVSATATDAAKPAEKPETEAAKTKEEAAKPEEEAPKPETRLAVIGDSDFAANFALGIQGNRDLFMNAVNWLAQQENLIAIRPRDADDRRITLTATRSSIAFWLCIVGTPVAVFGAGIYTWWRRR